ncbi:MAG: hypothetical protein ABJB40_00465 [Acidobacteriota bacterium]
MKKIIVLLSFFVALAVSNVFGQRETPAGAGDKNLAEGDGIKMRSVEMERMKQETRRTEAATFAPINKDIFARFPQIKEDFEGIQISEAAIITAFTTGKTIDYSLIESSADAINKKAKRLDSNLFAASVEKKADPAPDESGKQKIEKPKSVRDLIIELDKAIGSFVSSKIFGNIKVIEPEVAINTRTDLLNILKLSEKLSLEAKALK